MYIVHHNPANLAARSINMYVCMYVESLYSSYLFTWDKYKVPFHWESLSIFVSRPIFPELFQVAVNRAGHLADLGYICQLNWVEPFLCQSTTNGMSSHATVLVYAEMFLFQVTWTFWNCWKKEWWWWSFLALFGISKSWTTFPCDA